MTLKRLISPITFNVGRWAQLAQVLCIYEVILRERGRITGDCRWFISKWIRIANGMVQWNLDEMNFSYGTNVDCCHSVCVNVVISECGCCHAVIFRRPCWPLS